MRRRTFLTGTAASAALLAGCNSGTETETPTDGGGTEPTATSTATATPSDTPYSVEMAPVGEVEFESVPETWVANNGSWADMGIALGQEPPKGVWLTSRYHTQYYDEIDGLSVDKDDMTSMSNDGVSKELFYQFDADVHLIDPTFLKNRFGSWNRADVDEIESNVGPFFGNSIFSRSYGWHDSYQYYDLYGAFEKLSQVFQQRERYEAFVSLHEEFRANLDPHVPAASEAPSAAVVWGSGDQPDTFYPYVQSEGTSFKHLRDLNVQDALAASDVKDFHSSRGAIDYETLLDVDPEMLLVRGQEAKSAAQFEDTVVSFMQDHEVASDLTAVQNGDVYRAGPLYQGPITNFVVTERTASELYGVSESLYDRERVADIVAGDI
ncbi:ABC transporter substrate-binding protein [Halosegnis longus]|uniref:ABC transporter substrate-binding protein n=1 Tax=Halosegnis longus TaxID=2216012 RepID=UPI00129E0ED5|nr:ABC transporter substrate-binding protein [Halosegnis longus]